MNTESKNDSFAQFIASFRGNGSKKRTVKVPITLAKQEWQALRLLADYYELDLGEMFSRVFSNVDNPHERLHDLKINEIALANGSENVTLELNIHLQFSEWTTLAELAQIRLATIPETICHTYKLKEDSCDLVIALHGEELVELRD